MTSGAELTAGDRSRGPAASRCSGKLDLAVVIPYDPALTSQPWLLVAFPEQ